MSLLAHLLLGLAPGLLWLWFFRQKDDLEPEPAADLLRVFLLGAGAALAVLALRPRLEALLPAAPGPGRDLADAFLVTAAPEEVLKLAAFFLGAWLWREMDEPLDGIVYGIAAGLGFAAVENVVFLVRTADPAVVVQRAFTATLAHAAFTGMAGYALGLLRFSRSRWRFAVPPLGFALAVLLHGIYDYHLFRGGPERFLSLLFVLPLALLLLGIRIRAARARSAEYHP